MNVSVVSDITISSLIRSCVGITELNLASTSITNGALDEILEHLKTLVFLSVENTHCSLEFIESKNSLVFSSPPNGTTRYNLRADYCDDINFVKYVDHLAVSRYPGYNVDFVEYAHSRYNVDVPDTYDYRYKTAEEEAYLDYINNANVQEEEEEEEEEVDANEARYTHIDVHDEMPSQRSSTVERNSTRVQRQNFGGSSGRVNRRGSLDSTQFEQLKEQRAKLTQTTKLVPRPESTAHRLFTRNQDRLQSSAAENNRNVAPDDNEDGAGNKGEGNNDEDVDLFGVFI